MSNEDLINDTVKAGIEAFLKSDDEPEEPKDDSPKDDVKELPENEVPETEAPEVTEPEEAPAEGDLAKKYLGKDLKSASDEEIATLLTNTLAALGM